LTEHVVGLASHELTANVRNTHVAPLPKISDKESRWTAGPLTHAALKIAVEQFARKLRKGSGTPYLSHLFAVSALVMEHGGSEVQAAAGLLHDIIEDTPIDAPALQSRLTAAGVDDAVARHVVDIVEVNTDGKFGQPRNENTWHPRKHDYLNKLRAKAAGDPALLVSLADKVHNSEVTLVVIRGGTTATEFYTKPWFNAKAPAQMKYYTSLAGIFRERLGTDESAGPLVERLELAVAEIFADMTGPR